MLRPLHRLQNMLTFSLVIFILDVQFLLKYLDFWNSLTDTHSTIILYNKINLHFSDFEFHIVQFYPENFQNNF